MTRMTSLTLETVVGQTALCEGVAACMQRHVLLEESSGTGLVIRGHGKPRLLHRPPSFAKV